MAKFVKEFENGIIKNTLTFRGQEFTLTLGQWDKGSRTSKEMGFNIQLKLAFSDDEDLLDYLEEIDLDFDIWDEDAIEETLEELNDLE